MRRSSDDRPRRRKREIEMNNEMNDLLLELAEARTMRDGAKDLINKMLEEFKGTMNFMAVQNDSMRYVAMVAGLEEQIRELAVAEFKSTGEKKPHEKVVVKIFKTFKINDAKKVWDWAFKNLPAALKLDEKKIEKYANEFGEVEGTETGEEPRAQIATEL